MGLFLFKPRLTSFYSAHLSCQKIQFRFGCGCENIITLTSWEAIHKIQPGTLDRNIADKNSPRKNYPELCFITLTCALCCNWDMFLVTLSLSLLAFEHCQQTIALMQAIYRSNCDVSHKTYCGQPVFQQKRFLSRLGFVFQRFKLLLFEPCHQVDHMWEFTNSKYPSNWSSGLSQKRQRGVG